MKTKVEVNGYEIEIEEIDGRIMVKAVKEDEDGEEEVVEEFTIETEGSQAQGEEGDDEVQGFGDFDGEEEGDFGQSQGEDFDNEEGDDEEAEGDDEDEVKLESFQSFVNKRK